MITDQIKKILHLIPKSNYQRILVIGDLHEMYTDFHHLLHDLVKYDPQKDFLILLGDYIDKGNQPIKTIKAVMDLCQESPHVIALRGNHEDRMLQYFENDNSEWEREGSPSTIDAFHAMQKTAPEQFQKVIGFIKNLPLYYEMNLGSKHYIFVHAGFDITQPISRQNADTLCWIREAFINQYRGNDIVVIGHTPTMFLGDVSMSPQMLKNNILAMDTGACFPDGCISCKDLIYGHVWQSWN